MLGCGVCKSVQSYGVVHSWEGGTGSGLGAPGGVGGGGGGGGGGATRPQQAGVHFSPALARPLAPTWQPQSS